MLMSDLAQYLEEKLGQNKGATWDLTRWDDPVGGVTLDGERGVDLLETVKASVDFLWAQIKSGPRQSAAAVSGQ